MICLQAEVYICVHVCLHVRSENRSIFVEVDFIYGSPIVPLKYEGVGTVRVGFLK